MFASDAVNIVGITKSRNEYLNPIRIKQSQEQRSFDILERVVDSCYVLLI
jgi:hypothetical protein